MKLIASQLDLLLHHARALLDQLDLASKDEYLAAASAAIRDLRAASVSLWNLAFISFRPVVILLGILGRYLVVVLRVVAKHSVAHGWIAAREGYFQLQIATIWFVNFQRDLSSTAKCAELGALAIVVTLWLLRRHVRKNRYAERAAAWYREKKRRALRKYQNFVGRIAKTSSLLALVLPHLFYTVLVVGTKRIVPSVVTYLANRTYLCSIISFWHPLYLTYSVLRRSSHHLKYYKEDEVSQKNGEGTASRAMTPSILKAKSQQEIEMEGLRVEAVDLLKYWVVYAIILAVVRTGKLLPFVGHVLNVTTDDALAAPPRRFFGRKSPGFYSKLRLPGKVVEEITLVFFVWLRFMPGTITVSELKSSSNRSVAKSPGSRDLDKHRPVDILFGKLSPSVLSAMKSSAFLTKRAVGDSGNDGFLSAAIQHLKSALDIFVLMKLMSKSTQEWLITTIIESSALAPAMTTLLMPSYFTNFGVIYVSLVVPAGYSIISCNAIRNSGPKLETMMPKIDDGSRYLQFWVVHAAVSLLLQFLASLLSWIPLSTHATWFLWAYVQLEYSTRKIYSWFESEIGKKSLDENIVVRSTTRILAALPSNVGTSVNLDASNEVSTSDSLKSTAA
eukprot:CAMPEP_0172544838 /NCGR_PEP_ID=MMETSP1067-20121228/14895_1 /TAXON_ID=265564 ORGANISM="Thalassiosira punctigera, Strain Tpunct2005C2" /NCGR_SAMPLE_ID=MMETSP1067 /ASSEMBLY_ACC=CAM_ASM_000444 /LENGTH=616 /DNA_ID=CAMNT_0013331465 /DNA_START=38 /DNA_END=1888 /DNA_ORIENTATION=-